MSGLKIYLFIRNRCFYFPLLLQIKLFQPLQFLQIDVGAVNVLLVVVVHVQHCYEKNDDESDSCTSHTVVVADEAAAGAGAPAVVVKE